LPGSTGSNDARAPRRRGHVRLARLLLAAAVGPAVGALAGCTVGGSAPPRPDASPAFDAGAEPPEDAATLPPPTVDPCTPEGRGATIGAPCGGDGACDDGCFCNGVERCEAGVCVAGDDPCADDVECTADACLEEADRCFHDPQHEVCSDGDACNGAERCDRVTGCVGAAPLYCNDESACTVDSCDPAVGCVFTPRDLDGDGFTDGRCGGEDCDDDPRFGVDVNPDADEICDNRRDDDCDGARDFLDDECVPRNDTCAEAVVLPGPGTHSGSTRGLSGTYELSCRDPSFAADAVFRFALAETRTVTATVIGTDAAVAIREAARCADGPDLRCNAGRPPTAVAHALPPGEYAIVVQTGPSGAAFDLNLRFDEPAPPPPADTCPAAVDITSAPAAVPVAALLRDVPPSCTPRSPAYDDAYFFFDLAETGDVTVRTDASDGWHYASLGTACGDPGAEQRCVSGSSEQTMTRRSLPAGRYFVAVATSASSGEVSAAVDIRPPTPIPPNDRCSGAIALTDGAARRDTTVDFADDASGGSCAGTARLDAFYTFTLDEERRVTAVVADADGGSTRFYLTLLDGCGGAEVACVSSPSTVTYTDNRLPAGTYVLMVETPGTEPSEYFLELSVGPPL
jgi:hypothetical protein